MLGQLPMSRAALQTCGLGKFLARWTSPTNAPKGIPEELKTAATKVVAQWKAAIRAADSLKRRDSGDKYDPIQHLLCSASSLWFRKNFEHCSAPCCIAMHLSYDLVF